MPISNLPASFASYKFLIEPVQFVVGESDVIECEESYGSGCVSVVRRGEKPGSSFLGVG